MQFIYDNMVAAIIAGVVALLMVNLYQERAQATFRAQRYYAGRTQANALIETIKKDLNGIAGGEWDELDPPDMMEQPDEDANGVVVKYEFRSASDTTEGLRLYEYLLLQNATDCEMLDSDAHATSVPCYSMFRVRYNAADNPIDTSAVAMPSITNFMVEMLDGTGDPTNDPDAARALRVEISAITPHGPSSIIRETRWESVFWPEALRRLD